MTAEHTPAERSPARLANVWTIVVAAGAGTRFGSLKQYEALGTKRVLDWAIEAARSVSKGVVLAVAAARVDDVELGADAVVAGGSSRSDSVRAALSAVPEDADVIVVHDAARPLASAWLFEQVVSAVVEGVDGAVPALAISDTVKRVRGSEILETLDRRDLVTVQTPQAFRGEALRKAHAGGTEATDDAGLVEAAGGRIVLVAGDPANVKLTRPADLEGVRRAVELLKDAVQPGQQ